VIDRDRAAACVATALVCAMLAMACSAPEPGTPTPSFMEPFTAIQGVDTAVTIRGRGFDPSWKVSYTEPGATEVDVSFAARLGEHELVAVTHVDGETLSAVVPGTLLVGEYDLTVVSPGGEEGELARAFTILPGTIDPDGGSNDAAAVDAAAVDAGVVDGGAEDGALPDSAVPDAPASDLGAIDAVQADSAIPDAGAADTRASDASASDGAMPDTVASDTTALDATGIYATVPDVTTIDSAGTDTAQADTSLLDTSLPDTSLPDSSLPDSSLPDSSLPDSSLPDSSGCVLPGDWWNAAWTHRVRLSIDNSAQAEALSDFPVLVTLDAGFDYGSTQAGGVDLRFVDADGSSLLAHQIESWDTSGSSFVWVKVPTIDASSSADFFWMYYGNSGAADVQDGANTFSNAYLAVWHLDETGSSIVSSAAGAISCTLEGNGGGDPDAPGKINGATQLDGTSGWFQCGTGNIDPLVHHTISVWANLDFTPTPPPASFPNYMLVDLERYAPAPYAGLSLYVENPTGAIGRWYDNDYLYSTVLVPEGTWALVAIRGFLDASAGRLEVSLNGGPWTFLADGDTSRFLANTLNAPLTLGSWRGGGSACYTRGVIDEVRIASVERSEAWMRAQYLSMSGGFLTRGAAQTPCP